MVVVFDGLSMGIMSFAFGVFDMAKYYGVLDDLDVRVVAGEPSAALRGGGLACEAAMYSPPAAGPPGWISACT